MREAISSPSRRTRLTETGSELDSHAQDNAVVIRLLAKDGIPSIRGREKRGRGDGSGGRTYLFFGAAASSSG